MSDSDVSTKCSNMTEVDTSTNYQGCISKYPYNSYQKKSTTPRFCHLLVLWTLEKIVVRVVKVPASK